jgi:hypothetical protein
MKITLFLIMALTTFLGTSLATNIQAQTKRTGATTRPKAQVKGKVSPKAQAKGTLSFETGLVFKSGDVKPVARTTFYLLDDDLSKILADAGLQTPRGYESGSGDTNKDLINSFASSIVYSLVPAFKNFYPAAMTALKPHTIETVTTDFSGKATFSPVAAGTYYLMGVSETPNGYVIWNFKVELKAGKNSVTLDQNNAATAV